MRWDFAYFCVVWSHHREHFRLGPHAIKILNLPTSDNGPFVLNALCLSNRGLLVEILQFSRQAHFSVAGSIGRQPISLVKLLFCIFRICTIFLFCDSATILTSHLGKKTVIGQILRCDTDIFLSSFLRRHVFLQPKTNMDEVCSFSTFLVNKRTFCKVP